MRLRLTPREDSYFTLFTAQAEHLVTGANLLAEMLGADRAEAKAIGKRFAQAEHDADEAAHTIMNRLNQTFVTPFDRDDIYTLASRLDDCMDFMEEAADLIVLYKIDELPARVADQVQVLQRAAELTADAMPKLRAMSDLAEYWVEVNRLALVILTAQLLSYDAVSQVAKCRLLLLGFQESVSDDDIDTGHSSLQLLR